MKPIEEGCLVMVKNYSSEMDGRVFTITKYIGDIFPEAIGIRWGIDGEYIPLYYDDTQSDRVCSDFRDIYLMRIDGYEEQDQVTESKKKELFK